jgi:hypothetical protein
MFTGELKMSMIGLCGDNCEYCPRYIATRNGSMIELKKVKKLWVRLGLRSHDFPVQDMACQGCKPENKCAYTELRACISTKMHANCGLCDDYPCTLINSVLENSKKLKDRVNNICTQEEKEILQKAFLSKKEYFDRIYNISRKKV